MKPTTHALHVSRLADRFNAIGDEPRALAVLNDAASRLEATIASATAVGLGRRCNRMKADAAYLRASALRMANRNADALAKAGLSRLGERAEQAQYWHDQAMIARAERNDMAEALRQIAEYTNLAAGRIAAAALAKAGL